MNSFYSINITYIYVNFYNKELEIMRKSEKERVKKSKKELMNE